MPELDKLEIFFGDAKESPKLNKDFDWDDPDDEELGVTSEDVIGILGFDPKEFRQED